MAMRIEYLADFPDFLETLARWHHEEWHHLNPGDTVEKRQARMRAHLVKRQIPTTFVALDGDTLLGSACLASVGTLFAAMSNNMRLRELLLPLLLLPMILPALISCIEATALILAKS